jgi:outer membrane biosynthesis protein TonB
MNEKDMNTLLERDNILREAISRREQRQPSMPSDLNARLMQRMEQSDVKPKHRIWLYVVSGVAASILLLLTLHFWQKSEETPQSVVAKQDPPKQTITVKKPEVVEQKTVAVVEEPKPVQQAVPQKKVVAKVAKRQEVVEEKEKVQELPAAPVEEELMAVVEEPVYDPMIEDPYAFVMNQMQDIRSRGERLQQEVALAPW